MRMFSNTLYLFDQFLIIDSNFRFAINIQRNTQPEAENVTFHFNPRYNENVVVRNNKVKNVWVNEERGPLPVNKGESFKIELTIDQTQYSVIDIFLKLIQLLIFRFNL